MSVMEGSNVDLLILILSVGMTLVLLLVIIALFYLIKILRAVRTMSLKAEKIAGNVESASAFFRDTAGPVAVAKLISNIFDTIKHKESKRK